MGQFHTDTAQPSPPQDDHLSITVSPERVDRSRHLLITAMMVFPHVVRRTIFFSATVFLFLWLYHASYLGHPFQPRYNAFSCPGYITPSITHDGISVESAPVSTTGFAEINVVRRPDFSSSPFAYVFYATESNYACSVLVNIHRLNTIFNTTHRIIVLVRPDLESQYLTAFTAQNATVIPYDPPKLANNEVPYYQDVLLKLVAFRLHHYIPSLKRILVLDADQLILQSLDHVFDLPAVDVAAPRAYWQGHDSITSAFLLVCLSDRVWNKVSNALHTIGPDIFDMDLVNDLFKQTFLILPGDYATLNSHWETNELPNWWQGEVPRPTAHSPPPPDVLLDPPTPSLPPPDPPSDPDPPPAISPPVEPTPSPPPSDPDPPPAISPPVEPTPSPPPAEPPHQIANSTDLTDRTIKERIDREGLSARDLTEVEMTKRETSQEGTNEGVMNSEEGEDMAEKPTEETTTATTNKKETPYTAALYQVYADVKILHFTALGKPWSWPADTIEERKPLAHDLFREQFRTWQETAGQLCNPLWE